MRLVQCQPHRKESIFFRGLNFILDTVPNFESGRAKMYQTQTWQIELARGKRHIKRQLNKLNRERTYRQRDEKTQRHKDSRGTEKEKFREKSIFNLNLALSCKGHASSSFALLAIDLDRGTRKRGTEEKRKK